MKISKIKIKNLFGIKEIELGDKSYELLGKNGVGKTSIIDAIKFALKNQSVRDYVIREGEEEGEVLIELDNSIEIFRKARKGKATYKSVKQDGKDVQRPESFLKELFVEMQLNPVEFLELSEREQNRLILDLIDFDWDLKWIEEQFGEIVPKVNYEQNILGVLYEIQSEDGYYFQTRQDINREIRNKKAFIEDIVKDIPENYQYEYWKNFNLDEIYRKYEEGKSHNAKIEQAKTYLENVDEKVKALKTEKDLAIEKVIQVTNDKKNAINLEIEKLKARIRELELKSASLDNVKEEKIKTIEAEYQTKVTEHFAKAKEMTGIANEPYIDLSELETELSTAKKMLSLIREYERMLGLQNDVEELQEKSVTLTAKIEKARTLPGEILEKSNIPIKNITVKNGKPLINGLPISNLSDGEKLQLCVDVATAKENALRLLLIDGVEKLATDIRNDLYRKLKAKGIQFIATRTTDDDGLVILELENNDE